MTVTSTDEMDAWNVCTNDCMHGPEFKNPRNNSKMNKHSIKQR